MSFWSGKKLKAELKARDLITDFAEHRVDCAAYTLRMGRQYYISAAAEDINTNKVNQLAPNDSIVIPSGQFGVLLSEETVTVPADAIAFISMKNGLKSRGLVNVSGFHVDPGFSAPLKFAVFNAGPAPICIKHGEDCFLIWYADLDDADVAYAKTASQNRSYREGIRGTDVSSLTGAVVSTGVLAQKLSELQKSQEALRLYIGILSTIGGMLAAVVIGVIAFLTQEGIKAWLQGRFP